jgi:NitT/TauT family transport system substrate-binding protein
MATAALAETTTIRVGHFPNLTHLHGVVGHNFTRQGKGWFEQRLGPNAKIDWFIFNAGPKTPSFPSLATMCGHSCSY